MQNVEACCIDAERVGDRGNPPAGVGAHREGPARGIDDTRDDVKGVPLNGDGIAVAVFQPHQAAPRAIALQSAVFMANGAAPVRP